MEQREYMGYQSAEREIEIINNVNDLKCIVIVKSRDTFKDIILSCKDKIGLACHSENIGFSYCGITFKDLCTKIGDISCSGNRIYVFPRVA